MPYTLPYSKPNRRAGKRSIGSSIGVDEQDILFTFSGSDENGTAAVAEDIDGGAAHVEDPVDGDEEADPLSGEANHL